MLKSLEMIRKTITPEKVGASSSERVASIVKLSRPTIALNHSSGKVPLKNPPRFFPTNQTVPERLATPEFTLCPLTPADAELDHAALMASKAMLRLWSGSNWPKDNFSLAENLTDLTWHAQEHRDQIAFTYTVLNPAETACLGCVYIKPLASLVPTGSDAPIDVGDFEAAVRFWVRAERLIDGLDIRLLIALRSWFSHAWPFSRILFHTRTANQQQLAVFAAAGLSHRFNLDLEQRGGEHQFWE